MLELFYFLTNLKLKAIVLLFNLFWTIKGVTVEIKAIAIVAIEEDNINFSFLFKHF